MFSKAVSLARASAVGPCFSVVYSPFPVLRNELTGSELWARSTQRNCEYIRGHRFHGINYDEAAYGKQSDLEVLLLRIIDFDGWFSITTTPKGKNWLFELYLETERLMRDGSKDHYVQVGPTLDNPYIPPHALERLKSLPSRSYRQEVLGEFVETEGATFRYEDLARVFDADWRPESGPRADGLYVNAWDLGRKTSRTALTTLAYDHITGVEGELRGVEQRSFAGERWPTIFRAIEDREAYWKAGTIVDSTGVGDVVAQSVDVNPFPFIFTQKSRGELLLRLQKAVETPGRLRLPASWTRLYTQMQLHTAKEDAEGQTWDELDSLALAVFYAQTQTFSSPFAALG